MSISAVGIPKDAAFGNAPKYVPMEAIVPERYHAILKDLNKKLVEALAEGKGIGYVIMFGHADKYVEEKLTMAPILNDGGILQALTRGLAQHEAQQEDADLAFSISEQWTLPDNAALTKEEVTALIENGGADLEKRADKETACIIGIECPEGRFFGKAKVYGEEGQPRLMDDFVFAMSTKVEGYYVDFLSFREQIPEGATLQ